MILKFFLDFVNNYITKFGETENKFREPKPAIVSIDERTYAPLKNKIEELLTVKNLTENRMESRPRIATDYEKGHEKLCKNSWQEDYTKLHQYFLKTNQNKFLVYKCPGGGWGNRIRDILTSFHTAVATRRAFIIIYDKPSSLDKYLAPRHIKWNYKINETGLSVRNKNEILLANIKNHSNPAILQKLLNFSVEYSPKWVGNYHIYLANLVRYDLPVWPNIPQMFGCSFYYLFKKSDLLQRHLDVWKEVLGFNENIVIAMHIRQGDMVFQADAGDIRLTDMKFVDSSLNCITKIEKLIEAKYRTKKIIWYIAADSEKMKTYVKRKGGNKVKQIIGPVEHIGKPKKGNEDAGQLTMFLDFFLMQEADYRFYVSGSTMDNAVDFITFGTDNVGKGYENRKLGVCVIPKSLKT